MNTAKLFPSKKEKVCLCPGEVEALQIVVKNNEHSHSVENSNFTLCLYCYLSLGAVVHLPNCHWKDAR